MHRKTRKEEGAAQYKRARVEERAFVRCLRDIGYKVKRLDLV